MNALVRFTCIGCVILVALESSVVAQEPKDETTQKSIDYATQATSRIRDAALDPFSFTLLQAVAITRQEKNGRMTFYGCIHYVASNAFGGRIQRLDEYSVNKKGGLDVTSFGDLHCSFAKSYARTDVTADVVKALPPLQYSQPRKP